MAGNWQVARDQEIRKITTLNNQPFIKLHHQEAKSPGVNVRVTSYLISRPPMDGVKTTDEEKMHGQDPPATHRDDDGGMVAGSIPNQSLR